MGNPVTFVSKRRELRVIVKPADRTFDEARRPMVLRGERVEFSNHRFTTTDDNLVTWLKSHPLYNREFISNEGSAPPKVPDTDVKMVSGPTNTTGATISAPPQNVVHTLDEKPYEPVMTRDEIEGIMDKKFDSLLEKFTRIMQSQTLAKEEVVRPKKVFTCPVDGCGLVFKSGIEVGKHKKLAHPELS